MNKKPVPVMTMTSSSEEDTRKFGEQMGQKARPGSIFCLVGDLGTGKTVFAKGMAAGLGVTDYVVSPTFTIVHEYKGRLPFYHFDLYRLEDEDALFEIGWEEYIGLGGVCLVEWADQLEEAIPDDAVWIVLQKDLSKGPCFRRISVYREKPDFQSLSDLSQDWPDSQPDSWLDNKSESHAENGTPGGAR